MTCRLCFASVWTRTCLTTFPTSRAPHPPLTLTTWSCARSRGAMCRRMSCRISGELSTGLHSSLPGKLYNMLTSWLKWTYEAHKYSNIIRSNLVAICHWNFNECIGYSLYDKAFKGFALPYNTVVEVLVFYTTVNSQSSALRLICSRQISPNS